MILNEWLHITNRFIKKDENRKCTHLMLNGGCLNLEDDYMQFLEIYTKNIKHNNLYIIEKRTEIFPPKFTRLGKLRKH